MNWSRIGINRWVASDYLERVNNVYLPIVITPPPPNDPLPQLPVEAMSQNDPRWKSIRLGTSGVTIGQQGCLITCVAMVARFYGYDTDPARLNTWLKDHNGYSNGNLFNWYSTWLKVATWEECLNIPAPLNKLDEALAKGEPCICWVDFDPNTAVMDMHWIVITGKLGADDYVMIDPWDGWQGSFKSRYIDPSRWIFRIVSYRRNA
jgi:hypothetical protein